MLFHRAAGKLSISVFVGILAISLTSCGGGGGGGSTGNPTDPPSPNIKNALLLPVEEIVPPFDTVAALDEKVQFAVFLPPDLDPTAYSYQWYFSGKPVSRGPSDLEVNTAGRLPGTYLVDLLVSQGDKEALFTWRLQITESGVTNRPPVILQAWPPQSCVLARGTTATFTLVASDVDAADTLQYAWSVDNATIQGNGPEAQIATANLSAGRHSVAATVSDGIDRPAAERARYTWTVQVTTGTDQPPYISGAEPVGSPRTDSSGVLPFEVRAEVPEGVSPPVYRWEVDGIQQPTNEPVFHFVPSTEENLVMSGPHRITCSIAEADGDAGPIVGWTVYLDEEDEGTEQQEVENRAPVVVSTFPPVDTTAYLISGESRLFRVELDDPDGDVLTYRWLVNGVSQVTDGPVFVYSSSSTANVPVQVLVSDGHQVIGGAEGDTWYDLGQWQIAMLTGTRVITQVLPSAVVLDNGEPGTSSVGNWSVSGAVGCFGTNSVYSPKAGDSYTYKMKVPGPGQYDVRLWWTSWPSRSSAVPVTIQHRYGSEKVTVNQLTGGGLWNLLGKYDFLSDATITIHCEGGGFSTCADAASLSPVTAPPVPTGTPTAARAGETFVIEDGAQGTSYQGQWFYTPYANTRDNHYVWAQSSGASYTLSRGIATAGTYDVYACWNTDATRDPQVRYEISATSGTVTVTRDQRSNDAQWNLLGRYAFTGQVRVVVRARSAGTVCVDGVRFVPVTTTTPSTPPPPPPPPPPPVTRNVTVTWNAPTTNQDGTTCTDLAGYRIYRRSAGSAAGQYSSTVTLGNVRTYTYTALSAGTYYFAVSARDRSNNESRLSSEVSFTVE